MKDVLDQPAGSFTLFEIISKLSDIDILNLIKAEDSREYLRAFRREPFPSFFWERITSANIRFPSIRRPEKPFLAWLRWAKFQKSIAEIDFDSLPDSKSTRILASNAMRIEIEDSDAFFSALKLVFRKLAKDYKIFDQEKMENAIEELNVQQLLVSRVSELRPVRIQLPEFPVNNPADSWLLALVFETQEGETQLSQLLGRRQTKNAPLFFSENLIQEIRKLVLTLPGLNYMSTEVEISEPNDDKAFVDAEDSLLDVLEDIYIRLGALRNSLG